MTEIRHDETSTGSAMQMTGTSTRGVQDSFGLQEEGINKCIDIVHQFRSDKIFKAKASLLLQQTIPREGIEEDTFVKAYGAYLAGPRDARQFRALPRECWKKSWQHNKGLHNKQMGIVKGASNLNLDLPLLARLSEPAHPMGTQMTQMNIGVQCLCMEYQLRRHVLTQGPCKFGDFFLQWSCSFSCSCSFAFSL
jgi:hypothetical protein